MRRLLAGRVCELLRAADAAPTTTTAATTATARAAVQLTTKFDQAPVAYLLSALAGVIYIVATVTLFLGLFLTSTGFNQAFAAKRGVS